MDIKPNRYLCSAPPAYEAKLIEAPNALKAACLFAGTLGLTVIDDLRRIVTVHPCKLDERAIENSFHVQMMQMQGNSNTQAWTVLIDSCDYTAVLVLDNEDKKSD